MKKALYILGILDDLDIEWIATHGERRSLAGGTLLIEEGGAIPTALFIVLEGALTVSVGGRVLGRLEAGEIVGDISFVDSRPPSATVRAAEAARVLAIDRGLLRQRLEDDQAFAARFYRALATFLADRVRTRDLQDQAEGGHGEDPEDLSTEILDAVSLAGDRFTRILRRLQQS